MTKYVKNTYFQNISPGYVKTDILNDSGAPNSAIIEDQPALVSEDIANAIVYVIGTPAHVQINQLTVTALNERF